MNQQLKQFHWLLFNSKDISPDSKSVVGTSVVAATSVDQSSPTQTFDAIVSASELNDREP